MIVNRVMNEMTGTSADFTDENPIISQGVKAIATDTGVIKMGDGSSTWDELNSIETQEQGKLPLTQRIVAPVVADIDRILTETALTTAIQEVTTFDAQPDVYRTLSVSIIDGVENAWTFLTDDATGTIDTLAISLDGVLTFDLTAISVTNTNVAAEIITAITTADTEALLTTADIGTGDLTITGPEWVQLTITTTATTTVASVSETTALVVGQEDTSVTITGTDWAGNEITETIVGIDGSVIDGVTPFMTVTQIDLPVYDTSGDWVKIGVAEEFGLYRDIVASGDIIKSQSDTSGTLAAETVTTNTTGNTVKPWTTTPNGSIDYIVEYLGSNV